MEKDFDNWNVKKKQTEISGRNKFCYVGEVWWCLLGLNIGREHDGKGSFLRPVLIIKNFGPTCLIAPLSTSVQKHTFRISIGSVQDKESVVVISQLRVVDTKRFYNKICKLDAARFEIIRKFVRDML